MCLRVGRSMILRAMVSHTSLFPNSFSELDVASTPHSANKGVRLLLVLQERIKEGAFLLDVGPIGSVLMLVDAKSMIWDVNNE